MLSLFTHRDLLSSRTLIVHTCIALVDALFSAAPFLLFLFIFQTLLSQPDEHSRIIVLCGLVIASFVLRTITTRWLFAKLNQFGYEVSRQTRMEFANTLRKMPLGQLQRYSAAELHSIGIQDIEYSEQIFSHLYAQILSALCQTLVILGLLFYFNPTLAFASAIPIPLGLLAAWYLNHAARRQGKTLLLAMTDVNKGILEYIQNLPLLRSHNLTQDRFERLNKAMKQLSAQAVKMEIIGGLAPVSFIMLLQLGIPGMLILGNYLLLTETIELLTFLLFMLVTPRLYRPLSQLAIFNAELNYMQLANQRVESVLKTPLQSAKVEPPLQPDFSGIAVRFDHVDFAYEDQPVLTNFSCQAQAGEVIALVGPSGSGKTTLTQLLAGFWLPQSGNIEVLGHNTRAWPPEQLLQQMSIVFQDVFLFEASVEENLRAGNDALSQEDIEHACKLANCHDFIQGLPQGYKTQLKAGGFTLSGGERQRLSIARALLKDSPLVLLDEATSALDPENEHLIQQAITHLTREKTVFIIAHKLASIKHADQILVIDEGSLVEQGSHSDLLKQEGLYYQLWRQQRSSHGWSIK